MKMKMGKITAKLRDAVQVRFMVEGKEIKRYKNIEIPEELKELEIQNFRFDVPADEKGQITFIIDFASGILPKEYPADRTRVARTPKQEEPKPEVKAPEPKPDDSAKDITAPPQSEKPSAPTAKDTPPVAKDAAMPKTKETPAASPKPPATIEAKK